MNALHNVHSNAKALPARPESSASPDRPPDLNGAQMRALLPGTLRAAREHRAPRPHCQHRRHVGAYAARCALEERQSQI